MSERDVALLRTLAKRIDPLDAGAQNNLGVVFFQKGLAGDAVAAFERALELNPRLEVARRNVRVALRESGEMERRITALRAALATRPDDDTSRDALARTHLLGGDPGGAAREWGRLLKQRPESVTLHMKLAYAEAEQGHASRAVELVERAVALTPEDPAVRLQLAELLHRANLPTRAEHEARRVIETEPKLARAHLLLGQLLSETGREEAAAESLRLAEELDPELGRAEPHLSLDRYRSATAARARRDPMGEPAPEPEPEPEPVEASLGHVARATGLRRVGDLEGAAAELQAALERGEHPLEATQGLAEVLLLQGRPDAALPLYDGLLEELEGSPKLWNERGVALHRTGQLERALADYRKSVALDHGYALGWSNLGVALAQSDRTEAAERALRKAAEGDVPAEVLWNLGLFLSLEHRPMEAVEVYRAAVGLDDSVARSWTRLGSALFQAGRPAEARDALLEAVERDPQMAEARYHLGFALSALGDFQGALRETQRGMEREPVLPAPRYLLLMDVQFESGSLPAPDLDSGERVPAGTPVRAFEFEPEALDRAFAGLTEPDLARREDPAELEEAMRAAAAALERGQLAKAAEAAARAVALAPGAARTRLVQGRVLLRQGLAGEALERFEAVMAMGAEAERLEGLEGFVHALLQLGRSAEAVPAARELEAARGESGLLGRALLLVGQPDQAVRAFERAVANGEVDRATTTAYGHALLASGRPGDAEPVFRRALRIGHGVSARLGLGRALELLGDVRGAEDEYRRAVTTLPSHAPAVLGLAELEWRGGRPRDAVHTLVRFLDLDPTNVDALVKLGVWLDELGRSEQGERALRRAVGFAPENQAARLELDRLVAREGG